MDEDRHSIEQPETFTLTELGSPIAVGRTSEVFALDDGWVLKLLLPAFPSAIVAHEAAAAAIVGRAYPGAPRLRGLATAGGRPGLVYERIDGPTMDAFTRGHPWQVGRLGRQLGELHATVHDADGTGLADHRDALRAAIDGAAADLPRGAGDAALQRIEQLPRGGSLCHGDLHPGNVILGKGGTIAIDWGNAQRGNPVADVARSIYLMRDTPMHEPGFLGPVVKVLRRRFVAAYLARYRASRELDAAELHAWRLPILAARMAEGIHEELASLRAAITRELER